MDRTSVIEFHRSDRMHIGEYLLSGVVGTIIGGLLGVFGTLLVDKRSRCERNSIVLQDEFQTRSAKIADVLYVLDDEQLDWAQEDRPTNDQLNKMIVVGNWFDKAAALILENRVDTVLEERIGISDRIAEFWEAVNATKHKQIKLNTHKWNNMKQIYERRKCELKRHTA